MAVERSTDAITDQHHLQEYLQHLEGRIDALHMACKTLFEHVEDLEAENERLQDRVATLESEVVPDPEAKPYAELGRWEKVHQIRVALVEQAQSRRNGKAKMDYTDVKWLFDGHPSVGHVYTLMELVANADGFTYQDRDSQTNRITVNLEAVNDERVIHAANSSPDEEAR